LRFVEVTANGDDQPSSEVAGVVIGEDAEALGEGERLGDAGIRASGSTKRRAWPSGRRRRRRGEEEDGGDVEGEGEEVGCSQRSPWLFTAVVGVGGIVTRSGEGRERLRTATMDSTVAAAVRPPSLDPLRPSLVALVATPPVAVLTFFGLRFDAVALPLTTVARGLTGASAGYPRGRRV
jgi:hypothetical protein